MPNGGTTHKLGVSVFSASRFFQAGQGRISRTVEVQRRGVQVVSESSHERSLVWVDGLAVHMAAAREFVQAIQRGETPLPLVSPAPDGGGAQVRCVSPELLSMQPERIADVLGVSGPLERLALASPLSACPSCAAAVTLLLRPRDLGPLIQEHHGGAPATVAFESPSPALRDWAETGGFSLERSAEGILRATIDSTPIDQAFAARIEPTLRSAWKIPQLTVAITSPRGEMRLAPHGFCDSCRRHLAPRSAARVRALIRRGALQDLAGAAEGGILVAGATLGHILFAPLDGLLPCPALEKILTAGLLSRLTSLGLSRYPLACETNAMSSEDVALLSLCAGLAESAQDECAIIDIPHGLISPDRALCAQAMLESFAQDSAAVILGKPLAYIAHRKDSATAAPARGPLLATLRIAAPEGPASLEFAAHQGLSSPPQEVSAAIMRHLRSGGSGEGALISGPTISVSPEKSEVRLLQPLRSALSPRATVLEELKLFEPLVKLFTASIGAKALGIAPKDLSLRAKKGRGFACPTCGGIGVLLSPAPPAPRPAASPCASCDGGRFIAPARDILFRGRDLGEILNASFAESHDLLRVLPKSSASLELIERLDLAHLSLGFPNALLSYSERRRLELLLCALDGRPSRPLIACVESPYAGLSERHAVAVQSLMETPTLAPHTAWMNLS